ncbi:UNVERIFIED_CONTAM: hypothetical protein GTU68_053431 [Idotea baltica]|nr:hypothetical protein [Idotea baltica]
MGFARTSALSLRMAMVMFCGRNALSKATRGNFRRAA